jgi:UDP-3-O-[3-hydroxymyristoyl] glucosamine N-acyltransferase
MVFASTLSHKLSAISHAHELKTMNYSAQQIASLINGKLDGDPAITVNSFGKIEEAKEGQLSFLANPKYEEYLYTTKASIILINESLEPKHKLSATIIRVPDAYSAFAVLLSKYQEATMAQFSGVEQPSHIPATTRLGKNIYVGAFSHIGDNVILGDHVKIFPGCFVGNNVRIGDNSLLHPGVKIYHDCILGNQVTLHSGTVIGSDGFGFAPQPDGSYKKIPQLGNVVLEDDVEIGANTTIDRATMGSTIIKKGTKLDNLIQIAHNVEIGNNTVIAAQTGISGSTKIGNGVMIGGQVGIAGHIQIGEGTRIAGQSGVSKSTKPKTALSGSPAQENISGLRSQSLVRNLPDLEKRVRELENLVRQLLQERV